MNFLLPGSFRGLRSLSRLFVCLSIGTLSPNAFCALNDKVLVGLQSGNPSELAATVHGMANSRDLSPESVVLLKDLWRLDKNKYPSFQWDEINQPYVRLEVASGLLRANRMKIPGIDGTAIHHYVSSQLANDDPTIAVKAIVALGVAGDDRGVPLLGKIIASEGPLAPAAAIALYAIDTARSQAELRRLEQTVKSNELRDYLSAVRANSRQGDVVSMLPKQAASSAVPPSVREDNNKVSAVSAAVEYLQEKDAALLKTTAIGFLARNLGDPEIIKLLEDVWGENKQKYPNLAWQQLSQPGVRLEVGRLLGQRLRRNASKAATVKDIRAYILPYLSDDSVELRSAAAMALGAVGTNEDIEVLKNIVKRDLPVVGRDAVRGLAAMGTSEAKVALQDLEKEDVDSQLKGFIRHTVRSWWQD